MLTVLALDTATDFCSVALAYEGHITAQHVELPRAHNRHILNMVDTVLAAKQLSDIDLIACGVGPGSFTGLRIGCSVAQGLAWSLDLPVYAQCSLEAQAWSALAYQTLVLEPGDWLLSTIDAQINQLYWRWFRFSEGVLHPASEAMISPPTAIVGFPADGQVTVIGSGCHYQDLLHEGFPRPVEYQPSVRPMASVLADRLQGQALIELPTVAAMDLLPRYVQLDIGWKKLAEQGPHG
ncbi:tRNA (adenosine(37)-N6)-threonylcarbamoyltransferase complex dimerization subunit type 1 TsaB [Flavobacteriaceae bacterium]|nr:tRNA (adenosine(37)-N6)-threonylcarbamoyltransferase complex dimerization subunit type 1 TsaB [Flavobacteriaceae bacterium]